MDDGIQSTEKRQEYQLGGGHSGTKPSGTPSYMARRRQIWTRKVGMDKIKRERRRSGKDLLGIPSM